MAELLIRLLLELLFEPLARLPGYLLLIALFPAKDVEIDGGAVLACGLLFWTIAIGLMVWLWG